MKFKRVAVIEPSALGITQFIRGGKDLVEHVERKGLTGEQAHYAAKVKAVDESVGRGRDAIKENCIEKDTIVIFLSDQGGYFENPPFHGGKRIDTLYEVTARCV